MDLLPVLGHLLMQVLLNCIATDINGVDHHLFKWTHYRSYAFQYMQW